jgi:hypothetical protein
MTAFALSAEVLHKTDTQPEIQTVSALVRAGLSQFIGYPDLNHTLHGIDSETTLPVQANTTLSLEREYKCKTCTDAIIIEERHVVIEGVYSYRQQTGDVLDHHHLHTQCFQEHELLFWDQIFSTRMNKARHDAIVRRILQAKARRKTSRLAA